MTLYTTYYQSPIGEVEICGTDKAITSVLFVDSKKYVQFVGTKKIPDTKLPPLISECLTQLQQYFTGKRREFTIPIELSGTPFQLSVWRILSTIPFGTTFSYRDVAKRIGNEKAVRAVGMTNSNNRINIIVPCHRVIGSTGSLTGYGGGLERKEWLLNHEQGI